MPALYQYFQGCHTITYSEKWLPNMINLGIPHKLATNGSNLQLDKAKIDQYTVRGGDNPTCMDIRMKLYQMSGWIVEEPTNNQLWINRGAASWYQTMCNFFNNSSTHTFTEYKLIINNCFQKDNVFHRTISKSEPITVVVQWIKQSPGNFHWVELDFGNKTIYTH